MLWLALHLPALPLEAFCATLLAEQRTQPTVLLQEHRVHTVNDAAAQRGIKAGSKRATAMALAADLLVAQSCPQRNAAALRAVVHAALAFTPAVCLHGEPPLHLLLLELQGSLRLFGGLKKLQQKLLASLAPLGHQVQMAAAPTAWGAALLALWSPPAAVVATDLVHGPHATDLAMLQTLLDAAPVWLLGPGRQHWEALQGMGLQTVADLRALPRSGVTRRFGQALLDDLDRALGLQPDPRTWLQAPPRFDSRLELFARADTTEQVLHAAQILLARLVAWAQARQGRIAGFGLRMLHESRRQVATPATELQVQLAEPALDPAHLQLLLRERLAHCTLAAPTLELHLHCQHLVASPAPNGELFPTHASHDQGLTRLLERLCARLGEDRVCRLVAVADHRPERASRSVAATVATTAVARHAGHHTPNEVEPSALPLQRPVWLLPEPMPLAEREALPCLQGRPLQLLSGPERIETGWWDGHPVARDYFIAMATDGSLVWIYRGRLPVAGDEPSWYLQGRFA